MIEIGQIQVKKNPNTDVSLWLWLHTSCTWGVAVEQSVTVWKGNCKRSQELWLQIKLLPLNLQHDLIQIIYYLCARTDFKASWSSSTLSPQPLFSDEKNWGPGAGSTLLRVNVQLGSKQEKIESKAVWLQRLHLTTKLHCFSGPQSLIWERRVMIELIPWCSCEVQMS